MQRGPALFRGAWRASLCVVFAVACDDGAPKGDSADAGDAVEADGATNIPVCEPTQEVCDAVDNDCDGRVDESFRVGQACVIGEGGCATEGVMRCTADGSECDGTAGDPATEVCDGADNDCDGTIDEDAETACYTGPEDTGGVGRCLRGTAACVGGVQQDCEGEVFPTAEVCNEIDDDCDGNLDEDFGIGMSCTVGVGLCAVDGKRACELGGGGWYCAAAPDAASPEVCDGADNDCDGIVDEDADTECYSGPDGTQGAGRCRAGLATCTDAALGECVGEVLPSDETCNGADDDCDGDADEGFADLGEPCTVGRGACIADGRLICGPDGQTVLCAAQAEPPEQETCDGIDNDCDGDIDEDAASACYTGPPGTAGVGRCAMGTAACVDGEPGACIGETQPAGERCNGADDDCDGAHDEDFAGLGDACTVGLGACAAPGAIVCLPDGEGVLCAGAAGVPDVEVCDGVDDDCDGAVDEDTDVTCFSGPEDAAGVGLCELGLSVCVDGALGPCEDEVVPADEVCDGQDQDCDGRADEGPEGDGPLREACYEGPDGTEGVGPCVGGERRCEGGVFGACDDRGPDEEFCDELDNDCNGDVDDVAGGCACQPGAVRECYRGLGRTVGIGTCHRGIQRCADDGLSWRRCEGDVVPVAEQCDNEDTDCDGTTDEDVPGAGIACTVGAGVCAAQGVTVCLGEVGGLACGAELAAQPSDETCDGLDNDCDTTTDEGFPLGDPCEVGVGACIARGELGCAANGGVRCLAQPGAPSDELCDDQDNDCDGDVDEDLGLGDACSVGAGVCERDGVLRCGDRGQIECAAVAAPPQVETCDGLDNDCDGRMDEDDPSLNDPCDTGLAGVCAEGLTRCAAAALVCAQQVQPSDEVCDGLDNDCDGLDDEDQDGDPLAEVCYAGPPGTDGVGVCQAGVETCSQGVFGACVGQIVPGEERCNSVDDDCNGDVDDVGAGECACLPGEERDCYSGPEGTAGVGVCQTGTQQCLNDGSAYGPCQGEVRPGAEVCDDLDNDCNGAPDDAPGVGAACANGVGACRTDGQLQCDADAGNLRCDAVPGAPVDEVCDQIDNDCDGETDNVARRGEPCTAGVGACEAAGSLICDLNVQALRCSAEPAEPADGDICANGDDDDCDGRADEGDDCHNNAACLNDGGGLACTCDDGYAGDGLVCQNIDDCQPHPCGPGLCSDRLNAYVCNCDGTGYRGVNCEINIDECAEDLDDCADENASCDDTPGSFVCTCDEGFTGDGRVCADCPLENRQQFDREFEIDRFADWTAELRLVDLDADGDLDVLYSAWADDEIVWRQNAGDGTFGPRRVVSSVVIGAWAIETGDMDGDGDLDIVAGNRTTLGQILWFPNNGNGTFGAARVIAIAATRAVSIALVDLNGDDTLDVVFALEENDVISWFPNRGDGTFRQVRLLTRAVERPWTVVAGDLDGDGDQDLVSASIEDDKLAWYENDGNGGFGPQQVVSLLGDEAYAVTIADIDDDGSLDLVAGSCVDDEVSWYRGNGDGTFGGQQIISQDVDCAVAVTTADIDGDGLPDIVASSTADDEISWFASEGGGVFGGKQIVTRQRDALWSVRGGDIDGDGDIDLASSSRLDDRVMWYRNQFMCLP